MVSAQIQPSPELPTQSNTPLDTEPAPSFNESPAQSALRASFGGILDPLPTYRALASQLHRPAPQTSGKHVQGQITDKRKFCDMEPDHDATSSFPSTCPGAVTHPEHPESGPTKRLRIDSEEQHRRAEIANTFRELRQQGIVPRTLFFPSLPAELKKDAALRASIGVGLEELKTHQAKNKKMAWATFASESECVEKLLALNMTYPALKVSLHKPKQRKDGDCQYQLDKNAQIFDKKVREVMSRGGLGNTLMFRNMPVEVGCDEVERLFQDILESASVSCTSLRVRMALSKGRAGRNFWIVYSCVEACRMAFIHLLYKEVTFRCGKSVKLHPIIHDDSTDVDERKRRERARALGTQPSKGRAREAEVVTNSVDLLEGHLRATQTRFFFLPVQNSKQ